jgi:DNA-binding transcriptional LysR family regulator
MHKSGYVSCVEDINAIDLNLLRLFAAVHRFGNVTQAAQVLGVAQPVASHGLARLRKQLGNALFVRCVGGVRPTPYAERLAPSVQAALDALQRALVQNRHFDPLTSDRRFVLHMSDIGESRVLPGLMAQLRRTAPHVRVETRTFAHTDIADALDAGRIDFAFGALPYLDGVQSQVVTKDSYQLVLSRSHPLAGAFGPGQASLASLEALDFVGVSTQVEALHLLRRLGLQSQLRLTVQYFTALPAIVRECALAAIVPMAILTLFDRNAFCVVDGPWDHEPFSIYMYWSRRSEADAGAQWFRQAVQQCVDAMDAGALALPS